MHRKLPTELWITALVILLLGGPVFAYHGYKEFKTYQAHARIDDLVSGDFERAKKAYEELAIPTPENKAVLELAIASGDVRPVPNQLSYHPRHRLYGCSTALKRFAQRFLRRYPVQLSGKNALPLKNAIRLPGSYQ